MGFGLCGADSKELAVEEGSGFVVRRKHPLFMVWTPGQSIGLIEGTRLVDDGKIILGEEKRPSSLTVGEFLLCSEVGEVIVVGPYFKGFRMTLKVMAESFEGANDSKEFFVVDVVVEFGRLHGLGEESNRVPAVEKVGLFKNGTESEVTSIGDDTKRKGRIREGKDWGDGKGVNEGAKGRFLGRGPNVGDVFLCESKERVCNLGIVLDEATVKVAKAKEGLEFLNGLWLRPFGDTGNLGRVHGDGSFRNDDAEIFDRSLVKRAFLGFEEEVVFLEAGEDVVGKGVKEWQGGVEEENIIKVDNEMAFIDKVREDGVHKGLESRGCVTKTEGHDKWLEEAERALEGCFPFVTFVDTDVIVTPADVKLCEVTRSLELINEFGNKRKRSGIFDGDIVNGAIVLDGPKGTTASFGDEEERYSKGRRGGANVTFLQVVVDVFFKGEILSRGETVDTAFLDVGIGFEVNRMVPRLMLRETVRGLFAEDDVILLELCRDVIEILDRDEVGSESDRVCLLGANENGMRFLELSVYLKEAYRHDCTVILICYRQVI